MSDLDPDARARLVNMANIAIGKGSRVMIVFEVPATMEGVISASDILGDVQKRLPPGTDHGGNWAIKAVHNDRCKSRKSRDMDDCDCESLICECVQIDEADESLLRRTGGYDLEVETGGDEETSFN